ncbi:MAG: DEAD/DEAH box helicase [Lautropia sp.]|nr:DEAD/DEAH box helicase [Lautropia sp.]
MSHDQEKNLNDFPAEVAEEHPAPASGTTPDLQASGHVAEQTPNGQEAAFEAVSRDDESADAESHGGEAAAPGEAQPQDAVVNAAADVAGHGDEAPDGEHDALPDDPDNAFMQLGLCAQLVEALRRQDILQPSPVQQQAIPLLLEGRDLIASAPTGTGKTAAFLLPALQYIALNPAERPVPVAREARRGAGRGRPRVVNGPRVLVLTPTRELAQQVTKTSQALSRHLQRVSTVCITGGSSYFLQNKALSMPYEVLVATPGRLIDQIEGGKIDLSRVKLLVLDEADRMLDMGFSDDVIGIAEQCPAERQTVCFTATISHDVRELAGQLLKDPEWMTIERSEENLQPIDDHIIYVDNPGHRHQLLMACLNDTGLGQAIVFTATKMHAEELAEELLAEGFAVEALHGDMSQRDRTRALNRLRHGEVKVMVATDVAARGIDVSTITHVINYQLPRVAEDYVHRIGRTGRAGASGQAVSFVGREDVIPLHKIEHFIGRHIQVSEFPGLEAEFKPMPRKRPKKKGAAGGKGRVHGGARGSQGAFRSGRADGEGHWNRTARDGAHRSWAGTRHGHHGARDDSSSFRKFRDEKGGSEKPRAFDRDSAHSHDAEQGSRPFGSRDGDSGGHSFRSNDRHGEGRPYKSHERNGDGAGRPFKPRRDEGDGRSFRHDGGDGGWKKSRDFDGKRPFRSRDGEGGDRPFRSRDGEGRPFRSSERDGAARPFKSRREDGDSRFSRDSGDGGWKKPRGFDGDRPFRSRDGEGGGRPFKSRDRDGDGAARPFKSRREDGDKRFPRDSGDGGWKKSRGFDGDRPFRSRDGEGSGRPFRSRDGEGSARPFKARASGPAPLDPNRAFRTDSSESRPAPRSREGFGGPRRDDGGRGGRGGFGGPGRRGRG